MRLALIPPFNMLWVATTEEYQLLLPHNFRSVDYANWATGILKSPDQFTILDNGLAEDRQLEDMALLAMASYYKPSELIVPDVITERRASINWAVSFVETMTHAMEDHPYQGRLAFVAQGRTHHEALECAKAYLDDPLLSMYVRTIMIPRHLVTREQPHARLAVAKALREWMGASKAEIHLLGGSRFFPRELYHAVRDYPFIRGMDTSMPFVLAMEGIRIEEIEVGPAHRDADENYWTYQLKENRAGIALHNVSVMRRWIGDII